MFAMLGMFLQGNFMGSDMSKMFTKEPRAGLGKEAISPASIILPKAYRLYEIGH